MPNENLEIGTVYIFSPVNHTYFSWYLLNEVEQYFSQPFDGKSLQSIYFTGQVLGTYLGQKRIAGATYCIVLCESKLFADVKTSFLYQIRKRKLV